IVDFSGVEQFLDTPLKHYSSGMQLRLAFAVAAHLEPEILVIDEVLAVGDAEFQKRCMGKMEEVAKSGRTILFVSHNLGAVKQLCTKGLVLENGELNFTGNSIESIRTYSALYEDSDNHQSFWVNNIDENPKVLLKRIELINQEDKLSSTFTNSEDIFIHFHLKAFKSIQKFTQAFDLVKDDAIVFRSRQVDSIDFDSLIEGEEKHLICRIPKWFLNVGTYYIKPMISVHCEEYLSKAYDINLSFTIVFDQSRSPYHIVLNERNHPGFIFPTLEWSIQS
ncbi:MAG: polysaccharide ABC transporter ATP-binding protein, partial [Fidelibacterota bacterium]